MADNSPNKGLKITLHWLNQSRSHRVLFLLEELGLEYELKTYKRGKDKRAPKELDDVHPLGKSPVIGIENASGQKHVLAESGAIVEYLTDYFGQQFIPRRYPEGKEGEPGAETEEWLRYRYYIHYAEGSIMTPLVMQLVFNELKGPAVPFLARPITRIVAGQVEAQFLNPELKKQFQFLESQLASSGGDYLCGPNLTGADFLMIFPLESVVAAEMIKKEQYPHIYAYVDRLHARPAYQAAVKKAEAATGDPFSVTSREKSKI